jgi:hypothetical protein
MFVQINIVDGKILPNHTINNDGEELYEDDDLPSFITFIQEHGFMQSNNYFRAFLFVFAILDIALLGSTYLPPTNSYFQFLEKHVWTKVDKVLESILEVEDEKKTSSKKHD